MINSPGDIYVPRHELDAERSRAEVAESYARQYHLELLAEIGYRQEAHARADAAEDRAELAEGRCRDLALEAHSYLAQLQEMLLVVDVREYRRSERYRRRAFAMRARVAATRRNGREAIRHLSYEIRMLKAQLQIITHHAVRTWRGWG